MNDKGEWNSARVLDLNSTKDSKYTWLHFNDPHTDLMSYKNVSNETIIVGLQPSTGCFLRMNADSWNYAIIDTSKIGDKTKFEIPHYVVVNNSYERDSQFIDLLYNETILENRFFSYPKIRSVDRQINRLGQSLLKLPNMNTSGPHNGFSIKEKQENGKLKQLELTHFMKLNMTGVDSSENIIWASQSGVITNKTYYLCSSIIDVNDVVCKATGSHGLEVKDHGQTGRYAWIVGID